MNIERAEPSIPISPPDEDGMGQPEKTVEPISSETLQIEYVNAAKVGRDVLEITRSRESAGFTPYLNSKKFNEQDQSSIRPIESSTQLSEDVIAEAQRGSFALALEAAAQVSEARFSRNGNIKEDPDSLGDLSNILARGFELGRSLVTEGKERLLLDETRKMIARRKNVSPHEITASEEELKRFADDQFHSAGKRIFASKRSLEEYLS